MADVSANFNQKKLLTAIITLIPIAYFLRLNSYQLIFEEPRRALVALEMLLADNWIVPTTNGELYYNKPPLYNWILIGFMNLLGKAEWVVRLPSILSVFATAALHYRISNNYIGKQAALLSALFYLTSADILFYFSLLGEIDLFFALLVYLQCILIFHFYQHKKWHWLYLCSYLLTSAGVLTKGIPSLFFQGITLLVIFILNKDFKRVFSIWHLAGLLLLALTSGGYFYLYSIQHELGPYLARLFTETFSRTAMEMSVSDNVKYILNFPAMLIKISAPWCLLFLLTFKYGWKQKLRNNPFLIFCFWFCLANGLIYLLSPGTRERYLYMFLPFIFSLLAAVFYDNYLKENHLSVKRFYFFIGISVTAGLVGMGIFGILLHSWLPAILCIIIGAIIGYGLYQIEFKDSREWILACVLIILLARIGFDLVILPTKKQNDPYKTDAFKMSKIIKDESIYLSGPPEVRIDNVKFAGRPFITYKRNEPTYLGFQTSFYLSRYTGKILKYTKDSMLNTYYISLEKNQHPGKVNVYYRFNNQLNKEDNWYILYKYK
jgi:4-amino-4-deoxy-L-arabinose transferase-like glycosyltransferase